MLLTTRYTKFAATYISAVGLLICFAQTTWAQNPTPAPVDLNIVAHQDDDILFMNPDILNTVYIAGHRQVTVYITAGNIGLADNSPGFNLGPDPQYPLNREEGAIAGYSKLLQLADAKKKNPSQFDDFNAVSPSPTPAQTFGRDSRYPDGANGSCSICFRCEEHACEIATAGGAWTESNTAADLAGGSGRDTRGQKAQMKIGSRTLNVATIGAGPDGPRVTLIFLRVDSPRNVDGKHPNDPSLVSLAQLFTSPNTKLKIRSRFDQPGYTKQQLIDQLVQILQFYQPDIVRTQDTADCQPGAPCDQNGIIVDYPNAYSIPDEGCDWNGADQLYDHTDHVWGARFAREALKAYDHLLNVKIPSTYSIYRGYNVERRELPETRLTTEDFCLKKGIFFRYATHDDAAGIDTNPAIATGFDCFSYISIGYQQSVSVTPP